MAMKPKCFYMASVSPYAFGLLVADPKSKKKK